MAKNMHNVLYIMLDIEHISKFKSKTHEFQICVSSIDNPWKWNFELLIELM